MSTINWDIRDSDMELVEEIVDRALKMAGTYQGYKYTPNLRAPQRQSLTMDLVACHLNGCPLKLAELLKADDFNDVDDVWGIRRHMDRKTGKLTDCFLPRFAYLKEEG